MREKITVAQLKKAMSGEVEVLFEQVVEVINQAQPGRIIADSEEPVRQAMGLFRQRLYGKALQLRQQQSAPAFSPSRASAGADVGE